MTGCLPENDTKCDPSVVRSALNVSSTISVTLNRNDTGAEFRCEAQLDLGTVAPLPPPKMMSSPLNVTVYCEITLISCRYYCSNEKELVVVLTVGHCKTSAYTALYLNR